MRRTVLGFILIFFLLLPVISLADEEERKEWKKHQEITFYVGGGVVNDGRGGTDSDFSIRVEAEHRLSRRWSLTCSFGYFAGIYEFVNFPYYACDKVHNIDWVLDSYYTVTTIRQYSLAGDLGMRFYFYRLPEDRLALFFCGTLFSVFYERADFKFIRLDNLAEVNTYASCESLTLWPIRPRYIPDLV
jgi:hypothetical protein